MEELKSLSGYKAEMMEEKTFDGFKALKGKYKGVVKNFERFRKEGVSEDGFEWCIDKLQVDFQISETVEGDKGDNRYVRKEFDLSRDEWIADTFKSMLSMAMTITGEEPAYQYEDGDDKEKTIVKIVTALDPIVGKVANLSIYPSTHRKDWENKKGEKFKKGQVKVNYKGDEEMVVKIVREFKTKANNTQVATETIENF